ncbi:MAG: hypothetical protein A2V21_307970 [Deltaproteobacteria bacterium GWC2_55_46]|nr:MAG: hypothetical protein A2V21_307970 [Deltaproteobacteria bacterium GWC2_55_46]
MIFVHARGTLGVPEDFLTTFALTEAVSFFFVLSGFILAYVYPTLEGPAIRNFLIRRVARIWPVHALALLFLLAFGLFSLTPSPYIFTLNLFLLHSWFPFKDIYYSFNVPSWSISTEFAFYLFFPFLIKNFISTGRTKIILAAGLALLMVLISNYMDLPHNKDASSYQLTNIGLIYALPLTRLFEFCLGIWTCFLWKEYRHKIRWSAITVTVLEIAFVIAIAFFANLVMTSGIIGPELGSGTYIYIRRSGASLLFAGLIFVTALQSGYISRGLKLRPFVFLGEISYTIYIFHSPLIYAYMVYGHRLWFIPERFLYPAYFIALVAWCSLVWILFEKPVRKLIIKKLGRKPAIAPASSISNR